MKPKLFILSLVLGILTYFLFGGLSFEQKFVAGMTLFIGSMWVFEALPISTTALLIPVILAVAGIMTPKEAFTPFFDPIIALMFGGFVIARAANKYELDKYIAEKMLNIFPKTQNGLLLAMCLTATLLSFFIANTITTILLIPIGLGLVVRDKEYSRAMVLAIAFAASIGGIGLIIGTTPNAITAGLLENKGYSIGFLEWMLYCAPLAVLLSLVCWFVVGRSFQIRNKKVKVKIPSQKLNKNQKTVLAVTGLIFLLWITSVLPEPLGIQGHGVNSGVIGVFGTILFMALGLLDDQDISKIDWATLLLLGGGITLGISFAHVGLDASIADLLTNLITLYPYLTYAILVFAAALLTVVASNTGTAALLAPIVIAVGIDSGINVKLGAIAAAVATSTDFLLPTGTPPNAIAYATRKITLQDMFRVGSKLLIVTLPIIIVYFSLLDLLI
jgi:sodium-dependent dicarboxylate transporter 2/3/5